MLVTCFALYAAGMAPSPYWLDSSEFAAAGFELGVAHSPGHPLALLLGKACALLPLGNAALKVGLASAIAAATAAALVALIGAEVARRVLLATRGEADATTEGLLGAAAGACFGLGPALAFQAVRPEVYALHAALVAAAGWAICCYDRAGKLPDRRPVYGAALALGLAVANHHLLAFAFSLAALAAVVARRPGPRRLRFVGWMVAAGLLGLLVYLYLPLRAARHPEVNWGAPSTLARFVWTVSGQAFHKSLQRATAAPATTIVWLVAANLGLLALLAPIGAYALLRLRGTRRLALLLIGGAGVHALVPALVGFDEANPDAHGYLAAGVGFAAALAAAGGAIGLSFIARPRLRRGVASGLLLAALVVAAAAVPGWQRTRFADTARFAAELLDETPSRALLVTSNFQSVFALYYLRGVEGARPDVDNVHRHFLAWPGYREELALRVPSLAAELGERDLRDLPGLASRRRLLLEWDLDLDPALLRRLAPRGLLDELGPDAPGDGAATAAERRVDRLHVALDPAEPQSQRALFYFDFLDGARHCAAGRAATAGRAIARAERLLSGRRDPDLDALAAGCPIRR